MRLTILGAAPAYTNRRGAAASSYLVQQPIGDTAASLVLDLGQGSFSNLAATVEPSTLSGLVVSHLHPDHFVDLVALRHYLRWEFEPSRRVTVFGPAGLDGRIDALDGVPGFSAAALDVEPIPGDGHCRVGPFVVSARRVTHTDESYAFRISVDPGRTNGNGSKNGIASPGLVYSGDCSRPEDLVPLIRPGDTVLCEASFGAGPVAVGAEHMTSAKAATAAALGGAERLLLTHVLAGHPRAETLAAARAVFGGPVQLVTEGDTFEI
jgi:ribonuclease BN (tRNA processing enzyme)